MIRSAAAVAGIGAIVVAAFVRQASAPVVGVLEQPPQCNETRPAGVRPIFARRELTWLPLLARDSLRDLDLKAQQFTLAFDGKSLGTLNTTDAGFDGDDWTFRRDHFLDVVAGQQLPRIANRSHRFAGWCNAPAVRPVVAVTSGHYEDPESWKPFQPSPAVLDSVFPAFRRVVGKAYSCRHTISATGDSSEHDVAYRYAARDLVVVAAYRNARGREIVGVELKASVRPCDGFMDPQLLNHWFSMAEPPKHLGDEMDLLDAGDYDGDGRSELLFWTSGDDVDKYVLMYDDFSKQAAFYWNYH
jgi:hypothetical protein